MTQPVPTPLHRMWEDKSLIRDRARSLKKILDWPTVNGVYLVGAPSKRAFAMNKVILDLTAQWWTPQRDYPESVQIALIREEVGDPSNKMFNFIPHAPARCGLLDFIRVVLLLFLLLLAPPSPPPLLPPLPPLPRPLLPCQLFWTSTWDLPSSVRTAGPQPGTFLAQCAPLDLNLGPS